MFARTKNATRMISVHLSLTLKPRRFSVGGRTSGRLYKTLCIFIFTMLHWMHQTTISSWKRDRRRSLKRFVGLFEEDYLVDSSVFFRVASTNVSVPSAFFIFSTADADA